MSMVAETDLGTDVNLSHHVGALYTPLSLKYQSKRWVFFEDGDSLSDHDVVLILLPEDFGFVAT